MPESTTPIPFTHLRLHTEFSINDGLLTIGPLINRLNDLQMPAVALTDLANLFGLIKFYSSATRTGIKPICGCDLVVVDNEGAASHIVLLVKNHTGYLNLTRLISELYTEAAGIAEPVVNQEALAKYSEGLIALSGGLKSRTSLAV